MKDKLMKSFVLKSQPIALIGLFTFISIITLGQENSRKVDGFSINPKIGFYNFAGNDAGSILGIELNVFKNQMLYSSDFYRMEETVLFGPTPSEYFNQFGVLIGSFKGGKLFRFQYQGGLASLWGLKRTTLISEGTGLFPIDQYASNYFFTIGLSTKLGFKYIPFSFLAIGVDLQTNINLENVVYMPMLSLEIGKLRSN
jgi:hypothetical protein